MLQFVNNRFQFLYLFKMFIAIFDIEVPQDHGSLWDRFEDILGILSPSWTHYLLLLIRSQFIVLDLFVLLINFDLRIDRWIVFLLKDGVQLHDLLVQVIYFTIGVSTLLSPFVYFLFSLDMKSGNGLFNSCL
jgi:hypothetical protein